MQICNENSCTGCLACMNSCPKDAIEIGFGARGQMLPQIDEKKCINCGICKAVCPENTKLPLRSATKSYAAWNISESESSSGGVAAVMSRWILKHGGVVYGAAVVDRTAKHIRVSDEEMLPLLSGSKYVQSKIGMTYRQAKQDLQDKDRLVLFIGTPCQIAGLKAYLKKDYGNLFTVDLICHGTPPHQYLTEHLDKQTKGNWDSYSFRGKYDFSMTAYDGDDILYQRFCNQDLYFEAFLQGMTYRDSCYKCTYARPERVSDLTIGDFWGLKRATLQNQYKGRISVVLPNTEQGQSFFDKIKSDLIWEERNFEEAINEEQGNLLHPSVPHEERDIFLKFYSKGNFDKAILKTRFGKELWRKYKIPSMPVRAFNKIKRITANKLQKK